MKLFLAFLIYGNVILTAIFLGGCKGKTSHDDAVSTQDSHESKKPVEGTSQPVSKKNSGQVKQSSAQAPEPIKKKKRVKEVKGQICEWFGDQLGEFRPPRVSRASRPRG